MNSLILTDHEITNLKELISEIKLKNIPTTNEYEVLRIKDQKINLILYKSGKLVYHENRDTKRFLNSVLQKETGYDYVIGSDEVGKGEWYGPLVVVATALEPEEIIELRMLGVKDSKTIKTHKIMELAQKIIKMKYTYKYIILGSESYNKLYSTFQSEGKSLNDLMAWAHSRVIHQLLDQIKFDRAKVVIDRFDKKKTEHRLGNLDQTKIEIIQKKRAESETPVAAASIIAKYLFENEVNKLDGRYHLNLRKSDPSLIKPEILPNIAKTHFKNVKNFLIR